MGRVSPASVLLISALVLTSAFLWQPSEATEATDKPSGGFSTSSDTLKQEAESIFIDGLSNEQMQAMRANADRHEFQAEVNRLMKLIINSLYKNKEIFLRELMSNASDALDKIRLQSLTDPKALDATEEFSVRIKTNKEARTIHIIDTGIGMTKLDLINNLGTIAKSGTSEFLTKLTESQSSADASNLIGKFGVGFYSSFLVADKVVVISKHNDDEQYVWESDSSSFSITEDPRGNQLKRGTEIILHINPESEEYLQADHLKEILTKYSQFMNFPIYLWSSRVEQVAVDDSEQNGKDTEDTTENKAEEDVKVEEDKKSEQKTVDKVIWDWVQINLQKPIWRRKPSEVTESEYKELYRALSSDTEDPLGMIHFSAEGDAAFNAVLYIPKRSPGDIFGMNFNHKNRLKMYIRRVFIADAADDLLPKHLGFVIGVVDSDELPLNVSREMLQQSQLVKVIRKKIVRKIIEMIKKLSEEDYAKFWKEYASSVKVALIDDNINTLRWSKFLRYPSSFKSDGLISLEDYVSRMKTGQEAIYYLSGPSLEEVKKSPLAEGLLAKGYEIIYMIDPMDEYTIQSFTEFEKKQFKNVAKEDLALPQSEVAKARRETDNKEFEELLKWLQNDALKEKIDRALLSERLSGSPCALIAPTYGWSANTERILAAQASFKSDDPTANFYKNQKKILEINQRHPLIKELNKRVKVDGTDADAKEMAELLFGIAALQSGYDLRDSVEFSHRIERMMRKNLSVDEHETAEEEPIESEDTEEESSKSDEENDEGKKLKDDKTSEETTDSSNLGDQKTNIKEEL